MQKHCFFSAILVCSLVIPCEAALQTPLINSELLLRMATIPIQGWTPERVPDGAIFIDPIQSTGGLGVFRGGPDFQYDSFTGDVTVFAPPLLGPPSEFGIRKQYSPNKIRVIAGDYFAELQYIPQLTRYRRNTLETHYSRTGQELSLADDATSFVMWENDGIFDLNVTPGKLEIHIGDFGDLGAIELTMPSLLVSELGADVLEPSNNLLSPSFHRPFIMTPEIGFIVDYNEVNGPASLTYPLGSPDRISLLAQPQADLFFTPEPSSIILGTSAIALLLTFRMRVCRS